MIIPTKRNKTAKTPKITLDHAKTPENTPKEQLPPWAQKLATSLWDEVPSNAITVETFSGSTGMPYQMAGTKLRQLALKGALKVAQRGKVKYYWPA